MSYDLQVWSTNPAPCPSCLPDSSGWRAAGEGWAYERRAWQVNVGPADRVLPEDIPNGVAACLPGIGFLTEVNLAPIGARQAARKFLERAATAIAKAGHGVIFDPQLDAVTTPKGVQRFVSPGPDERASLVALSWWFTEGSLADGSAFEPLLDVIARVLPDALPRRYGLYEPPQHVYSDTGRTHLVKFLNDHARGIGIVWYPHTPIAHVSLGIPDHIGGSRQGYRAGRLSIEVDAEALCQPGWPFALDQAWRKISSVVRPFYGDVRTLHGFRRTRGRYWIARESEHHPVCSWWWAGIPKGPVHAAVLGEQYRSLWPGFANVAKVEAGLAFLSTSDWRSGEDAFQLAAPPPLGIRQPAPEFGSPDTARAYPVTWPFEPPRVA